MMGWGSGYLNLPSGERIEAGYLIPDVCHHEGCLEDINRGLAYRCGGGDFDAGCGWYFCYEHLSFTNSDIEQLCEPCLAEEEATS